MMSEDTAAELSAMMRNVVERAPAPAARSRASRSPARPAPPRSGDGTDDPWFIGFTDKLAVAAVRRAPDRRVGRRHRRADRRRRSCRRWGSRCTSRARHDHRRPLPGPQAARLGRHGRRLLRAGPAARPPGRAEAAVPPLRRGRAVRRALPPRGVERGRPAAPEHRRRLRPRRVGRHLLHRDGVHRGPHAQGRRSASAARRRPRRRSTSSMQILRAARFAHQRGDRAPRHQAAQRHGRRRGPRQGHRLRHRPRRRVGHDRDRLDHGHGAVPVARAGAGQAGRRALGPLLDRHRALRDADRPRAVRRRVAGHGRAQAGLRAADAAARARPGGAAGARGGRAAGAGEGPGAPVRGRRRVHRRARGRRTLEPIAAAPVLPPPVEVLGARTEPRPRRWWLWLAGRCSRCAAIAHRRLPDAQARAADGAERDRPRRGDRLADPAEPRLRGRTSSASRTPTSRATRWRRRTRGRARRPRRARP